MKKIVKGIEPDVLQEFRDQNPYSDWKTGFKRNAGKYANSQIRETLIHEQKGLCVYCEIDLKDGKGMALHDFRVEHFFPENPKPADRKDDGINYALHWPNMFGCCTGGNSRDVVDPNERYSNPDYNCDVPKSNHNWTQELLNPLTDIPAFPPLFSFNEEGHMSISQECSSTARAKAQHTISLLNLDSVKLRRFREAIIQKLREQISYISPDALTPETLGELARSHLIPDQYGVISAFFSTIRWYLGPMAEEVLVQAGYDG